MKKIETAKSSWLKDPESRKAYDALENEFSIARELIRARARAGLTQTELANQMKTTQSAIARMESGRNFPSLSTLARFCEATGERLTLVLEPRSKAESGGGPWAGDQWLDADQCGGPLGQLAYGATAKHERRESQGEPRREWREEKEDGMAVYEILEEYVHGQRGDIDQGKPITVEVRDRDTFERLVVKARIAPPGSDLEGSEQLVLRDLAENVSADDWSIVVIEELDPEAVDIKPVSDFRRGAGSGA